MELGPRACSLTRLFRSRRFTHNKRLRWYADDLFCGTFPHASAAYVFIVDGIAVYVGSTTNMNVRMRQHRNTSKWPSNVLVKYRPSKKYGDWAMRELRLIRRLRPEFNTKCLSALGQEKVHA